MASAINLSPTTSLNNTLSLSENCSAHPKCHSFGQVSWPRRNELLVSPSKQSLVASGFVSAVAAAVRGSATEKACALSEFWKEVQGCNNWEDLLDPLHPLLRREIIRYGEFVGACYKAFDLDPTSKRYLNCKYGKKKMFSEAGMENCGYQVTKYIYATPPDINFPIQNSSSRWIGYVAVSSDEAVQRLGRRDIVITFRGTVTNHEWIANLMSSLSPPMLDPHNSRPEVKVESGFLSLYTSEESSKFGVESCREQLLSEVSRLLNKYKGEKNVSITMAGHSMGSALALLLAYDIAELGLNKENRKSEVPVTVFSFAGPRVGNSEFKTRCEELGVKVLRIANVNDPITKLPGFLFNENFRVLFGRFEFPWSCSFYAHVGVELMLDFFNFQNPSCVHDLESYIGLLRCPRQKEQQIQRDYGVLDLLDKAKELLLNAQNINILPEMFWTGRDAWGDLGSVSKDIMSSWGDEVIFGLALLFVVGS